MTTSEQIYSAVETAWEDNAKVGVVFEVMDSAGVVHDQHYPDRGLITMPNTLPLNKQEGHCDWYVSHTTIFNPHITQVRSLAKLRLV